jgi:hypothetical protein
MTYQADVQTADWRDRLNLAAPQGPGDDDIRGAADDEDDEDDDFDDGDEELDEDAEEDEDEDDAGGR